MVILSVCSWKNCKNTLISFIDNNYSKKPGIGSVMITNQSRVFIYK